MGPKCVKVLANLALLFVFPVAEGASGGVASRPGPGSSCSTSGSKAMTVGDPEIAFVPAIKSVELTPERGGLIVEYDFASALKPVPEGVYFSWAVYLYRARSDADSATKSVELEVQDRGTGWDPAGWTILAATYYTSSPVAGNISTDAGRKQLRVFFPAGFANLEPPFYWFATQEEYRSYLPAKTIDHNIFGSVNTDCPAGVRQSPNSLPNPAKLVAAG